jgi:hypothetical protein
MYADDNALITGNRFASAYVHAVGFAVTISDNDFFWSNLELDYVWEANVTGNRFNGSTSGAPSNWHTSDVKIVDSCVNINISNNNFDNNAAIIFGWNTYSNEFVIADNVFTASKGILMDGDWDKTSFRLEGFTITGNSMSTNWGGNSNHPPRINLGEEDSAVFNGVISNNLITTTDDDLEAVIRIVDINNSPEGGMIISDNYIHGYNGRSWAIKCQSYTNAYDSDITITGNHCTRMDGIYVYGYDVVTVSDNSIYGNGSSYSMGFMGGQIGVNQARTAIVKDNYVSMGNATPDSTIFHNAVISVDTEYATVSGNRVVGHQIAGQIDTAIEIHVDETAYVYDNEYVGVDARIGGYVALTKEIDIDGGNGPHRVGENAAKVLISNLAAADVEFLNARSIISSKEGIIVTTGGAARIPFMEDAEIISVSALIDTAPTGASLIVDLIDSGGTTMFTTQGNRPTILATEFESGAEYPDVTAVAAGSYVKVQVDQVGSSEPGQDLTVLILWRRA